MQKDSGLKAFILGHISDFLIEARRLARLFHFAFHAVLQGG
jgi:hypothetical protein